MLMVYACTSNRRAYLSHLSFIGNCKLHQSIAGADNDRAPYNCFNGFVHGVLVALPIFSSIDKQYKKNSMSDVIILPHSSPESPSSDHAIMSGFVPGYLS